MLAPIDSMSSHPSHFRGALPKPNPFRFKTTIDPSPEQLPQPAQTTPLMPEAQDAPQRLRQPFSSIFDGDPAHPNMDQRDIFRLWQDGHGSDSFPLQRRSR